MIKYEYAGIVTNVVDGDTADCVLDMGFHLSQIIRFRLIDIDAPERGKPGANEATQWLKDMILGKEVIVQSHKGDSFGRWLARIYVGVPDQGLICINSEMIKVGHAVPYAQK